MLNIVFDFVSRGRSGRCIRIGVSLWEFLFMMLESSWTPTWHAILMIPPDSGPINTFYVDDGDINCVCHMATTWPNYSKVVMKFIAPLANDCTDWLQS